MTYERIKVQALCPTIGAEIHGVDLAKPLDTQTFEEIHRAFLAYKVIFFRDQCIETDEHIAFSRRFGELEVHPFAPHKEGHPEVMQLRHGPLSRGTENNWHSDVTWRREPSLGSVLRAVEVPEVGGDTLFADMHAAYEGLSSELKRQLEGVVAVHDFTRVFGRGLAKEKLERMQAEYPPVEHPVIRTHPETGEKGIYVNVAFTSHIQGMKEEESCQLLLHLYRQAWFPEVQCRFRWKKDSIAFWDNRITQHYAASDYFPKVRRMERVTIVGDRPV
jgi:taurine dioxygenase